MPLSDPPFPCRIQLPRHRHGGPRHRRWTRPVSHGIPGNNTRDLLTCPPGADLKLHGQRVSTHLLAASLALVLLAIFTSPGNGQFKRSSGTTTQPRPVTDAPDQPKKADDQSNSSKSPPSAGPSLDSMKLPASAIVVLCEQAQQALELIPRAVVLAPEEYQKLLDQIEQLKKRLRTEKPEAPSICRISG